VIEGVASRFLSLQGAERKNPLTFDSYAELRDWFRDLVYATTWMRWCSAERRQFQLRRRCA
jgi:hypothetical protein